MIDGSGKGAQALAKPGVELYLKHGHKSDTTIPMSNSENKTRKLGYSQNNIKYGNIINVKSIKKRRLQSSLLVRKYTTILRTRWINYIIFRGRNSTLER